MVWWVCACWAMQRVCWHLQVVVATPCCFGRFVGHSNRGDSPFGRAGGEEKGHSSRGWAVDFPGDFEALQLGFGGALDRIARPDSVVGPVAPLVDGVARPDWGVERQAPVFAKLTRNGTLGNCDCVRAINEGKWCGKCDHKGDARRPSSDHGKSRNCRCKVQFLQGPPVCTWSRFDSIIDDNFDTQYLSYEERPRSPRDA